MFYQKLNESLQKQKPFQETQVSFLWGIDMILIWHCIDIKYLSASTKEDVGHFGCH